MGIRTRLGVLQDQDHREHRHDRQRDAAHVHRRRTSRVRAARRGFSSACAAGVSDFSGPVELSFGSSGGSGPPLSRREARGRSRSDSVIYFVARRGPTPGERTGLARASTTCCNPSLGISLARGVPDPRADRPPAGAAEGVQAATIGKPEGRRAKRVSAWSWGPKRHTEADRLFRTSTEVPEQTTW